MNVHRTERGFEAMVFTTSRDEAVRVQQSSAIDDDLEGAYEHPGVSYLWLGDAHLSRTDVLRLLPHLAAWAETGSLIVPAAAGAEEAG